MFSTAVASPINMCALSSAFFKSNLILFVVVSSLNLTNSAMKSFKFKILGLSSTIANVLKPKELSMLVS